MEWERKPNPILETLTVLLEDRTTSLILSFIVIPALLLAALWLPPISLGDRVLDNEFVAIPETGGSVNDPDGTQVVFLAEGLSKPVKATMSSVPRLEFLAGNISAELRSAAAALPAQLVLKSPVYQVRLKGDEPTAVVVNIPIPNDAEPYVLLDVYEWTGEQWVWLPHKLYPEDEQLEVRLSRLPRTFAVVQAKRTMASVGAELQEQGDFLAQAGPTLTEASPRLYMMNEDGTISQLAAEPESLRGSGAVIVPVIHNRQADGVIRSDWTDNLLIQPDVWQGHVDQIVALVNERGYAGIEVDYRNVDPALRDDFTAFVRALADRLHEQGKLLVVRVPTPRRISEDEFDSGAYDLVAIGQAADQVRLIAPVEPDAWTPGGDVDALLTWATGKVNRYKLAVVVPAASYDVTQDKEPVPVRYEEAVRALGQVRLAGVERGVAMPGQVVRLVASAIQGSTLDPATQTYRFTSTSPDGQWRVLLLANAASLARKLDVVGRYAVGGVLVPDAEYADPRVWDVLAEYRQGKGSLPFVENQFALVVQLRNERGEQVAAQVQPLEKGEAVVRVPEEPGAYQIAAAISDDGGTTTYGDPVEQRIIVPTATPEPTSTPTPTPSPTPVPPTPTPRPRAGGGGNQGGGNQAGTKPPPSSPPPPPSTAPSGPMAYGIQAHLIYQDKARIMRMIQGLGFNWVKQQIEWKVFEPAPGQIQWGEMDSIVEVARAHGIKVLFSIVKSPKWARPPGADLSVEGPPADPQTYANFVRAVAARYCGKGVDAIEVWNEQNLHYEWGNQPLSAADYMNLLKPAYRAIKEACPSMIVISGALTPAGNVGNLARDDVEYLQEMYNFGLKQYSDAIGAHPSGYNCPVDADWRTVQDPTAKFRGPFDNRHRSWCFRGTMEGYRNVMVANGDANKKIWATEFGWAVGPAVNAAYGYADDNTYEEQARWTVQAYQMARNWGWVGGMFLWNLNFKMVAPGSEQAQWGIVDEFGNPLPTYYALANMPKR